MIGINKKVKITPRTGKQDTVIAELVGISSFEKGGITLSIKFDGKGVENFYPAQLEDFYFDFIDD